MRIITKQYFLNNIKDNKLAKKYIPGISKLILNDGINWESVCYFELENNKVFFLDYNLDAIFVPTKYEITENEIKSENIITDDWALIHLSDKCSHNKNNLNKALDWSCQYNSTEDQDMFLKLLELQSGSWKLKNERINEDITFSLKIDKLFGSEVYLYIGIDELSIYPFKEEEVRNKIHFIKKLIEWKVVI